MINARMEMILTWGFSTLVGPFEKKVGSFFSAKRLKNK
jgi:hypothetical protein